MPILIQSFSFNLHARIPTGCLILNLLFHLANAGGNDYAGHVFAREASFNVASTDVEDHELLEVELDFHLVQAFLNRSHFCLN